PLPGSSARGEEGRGKYRPTCSPLHLGGCAVVSAGRNVALGQSATPVRSALERCGADGQVERAVAAQERGPAAGYQAGFGSERAGELALEPGAWVRGDDVGQEGRWELPRAESDDVDAGAG